MNNPYRYVGEKLLEPAGPDLWPLAILYFDPNTRGLKVAIAGQGAELIVGHGRKIGVIMEAQARQLCKQTGPTSGAVRSTRPSSPRGQPNPPPPAGPVDAA